MAQMRERERTTTATEDARVRRYRDAEQRLWEYAGVTPKEHRISLAQSRVTVRVQEVGEGEAALFIHGGPNAGTTWAPLVGKLRGIRCLIVDRPGTGLSDPLPLDARSLPTFADRFVSDVLDELKVTRAHLVVSSLGGYVGLRSAAASPDRVARIVQMGCPAFVPGLRVPPFMRFLAVPGGHQLLGLLPPADRVNRAIFRQIGHGASLDAKRIPQVFFDWYLALQRYTSTSRNETALIARISSLRGFDPSLTLGRALLATVTARTRFLWGEDDAFGGSDVAHGLVALMPDAELEVVPRGGHLPWLDDPGRAAQVTQRFLLG